MKKISPKAFWIGFLGAVFIICVLVFFIFGIIITLIVWASLIFGVIVFYPFLPHMSVVQNFALYQYELRCNIIRVLNLARFDSSIKFGWMAEKEILESIKCIFNDDRDHERWFYSALRDLRRKGAIAESDVPVIYLKNPPEKKGFVTAYKLEDSSDYKPRRPKWLPKENKKENDGIDAVTAH